MFTRFTFVLHHSAYLFACAATIPFVDDIEKWGKIVLLLLHAVYAITDSNKPYTFFGKKSK